MQLIWVILFLFILVILAVIPYLYSIYIDKHRAPAVSKQKTKEDIIREKHNSQKLLLEPIHNPAMVKWWNLQDFELKQECIEMYYNRQDAKNMWWESLPVGVKKSLAFSFSKSDHIDISQREIEVIYQANVGKEEYSKFLDEMSIQSWWENNSFLRKEQMILLSNKLSAMDYFSK